MGGYFREKVSEILFKVLIILLEVLYSTFHQRMEGSSFGHTLHCFVDSFQVSIIDKPIVSYNMRKNLFCFLRKKIIKALDGRIGMAGKIFQRGFMIFGPVLR